MKRRNTTSPKPAKARRGKTTKSNRANPAKVGRNRPSFLPSQDPEVARLTRERDEALEQLSAASEVLKVISSSPGDLKPVFEAILENAVRICDAKFGALFRYNNETLDPVALFGASPALAEFLRQRGSFRPPTGTPLDRLLRTKDVIRSADDSAGPSPGASARFGGARSLIAVPMVKENTLIGAISVNQEVRPFTDKQIALVQNFAAQAVIAIENTRLLNELRQRTSDLTESLEQQTATSDVLKVISSSPGDLQPVFATILQNAANICRANFTTLFLVENDTYRTAAMHNVPLDHLELRKRDPVIRGSDNPLLRVGKAKQALEIADALTDATYASDAQFRDFVAATDVRTLLLIPMLKDEEVIGVLNAYRQEVRPFTEKQIALLMNFAAQAVIAIENTRLLNELRQSLEQQTATSEVLQVISSSPGELEPVFQAMLENATRICEAKFGVLSLNEGDALRVVAMHNAPPGYVELRRLEPTFRPTGNLGVLHQRAVATKRAVQTADVADTMAGNEDPQARNFAAVTGARTIIIVPMLKDDGPVGLITIYRQEVRPFTDKEIELLTNFAAEAVIAIENARLLNELRQRTADLTESLENLRTAQDRLVQTEKLASLGQLTAGIAHEIKNPLNFVNNFSGLSVELVEELEEGLKGVTLDDKRRSEFGELAETLRGNLQKVVQHGRRADAIVKNMLLHSRQGSGEHRPMDINALVEESLNLAYHGARAEKQGFNITLERSFDPAAGEVDLFPQEITRVLLNLISNGFYAATKRKAEVNGGDYEPTVTAATKNLGNSVEIRIRDNGTGIPPEVRQKLFNPFFTTKPAGEGTGLGLSISHDIIVKQHGGAIGVETEPGEFTEFRIVLPRGAATVAKAGERA